MIVQELQAINTTTFCQGLKELLFETFRSESTYQHEKKRLREMLYTRAWLIHLWLMLWRVFYALLGNSYWQVSYENYKDNPKLVPEKVT